MPPAPSAAAQPGTPLWAPPLRDGLAYVEVPIAVVGLTDHVPDRDAIVAGTAGAPSLSSSSPALVGYVLAYGLRRATGSRSPSSGRTARRSARPGSTWSEDAPRATRAAGRRAPPEGWPPGIYRVEARVRRGERTFARAAEFAVAQ